MKNIKKAFSQRESMLFLVVFVTFVLLSLASDNFLTMSNLMALLMSLSVQSIIVVAMVNLLISGGFDMSVGSVVAFSGMIAALMAKGNFPVAAAIILGILSGALVGLVNGMLITFLKVPPFVATLAMMNITRGLVHAISEGKSISGLPDGFKVLGQGMLGPVQLPIVFAIVFVIVGDIALRKMKFFRQSFYVGGNEKSARLSGINVTTVRLVSYTLTGLFAGFAGVVQTGRLGSAMATTGTGMEMNVLTAAIIGGASLSGGEGSVFGGFLGAVLMATVTNAVNLLGVNVYWQTFITGMTLLIAVLIDLLGKAKKERAGKKLNQRAA